MNIRRCLFVALRMLILTLNGHEGLIAGSEFVDECRGVLSGENHLEASLGEPLTIPCVVCPASGLNRHIHRTVQWEHESIPVQESVEVKAYMRAKREFVLRIRSMTQDYLGNYTCIVDDGQGQTYRKRVEVSLLPPPPVWHLTEPAPADLSGEGRLLSWLAASRLPIINFQLEVRVLGGEEGADWVSIVVPFHNLGQVSGHHARRSHNKHAGHHNSRKAGHHGGSHRNGGADRAHHGNKNHHHGVVDLDTNYFLQNYTLQGLNPDKSYEARLRMRSIGGVSPYSTVLRIEPPMPEVEAGVLADQQEDDPVPVSHLQKEERKPLFLFSASGTACGAPTVASLAIMTVMVLSTY